ncbi:DUF2865 domain-containing protein [Alsobacter sp. SYSU BS001988]
MLLGLAIASSAQAEGCPDQRRWPWSDRAAINGALRSEYGQLHASYGAMGCARRPAVITGAEDYCAVLAERLAAIHRELQLNHWFGKRVTACGPEGSRPPLALAPVEADEAAAQAAPVPRAKAPRGRAAPAPGVAEATQRAPEARLPRPVEPRAARRGPAAQVPAATPQRTRAADADAETRPPARDARIEARAPVPPRIAPPAAPRPTDASLSPSTLAFAPAAEGRQPQPAPPPTSGAIAALPPLWIAAPAPTRISAGYLASVAQAGAYAVTEPPVEPPGSPLRKRFMAKGGRFACVRTCDGFYFPLNQSIRGGDAQDMCTSLCPGARTEVFRTSAGGAMADAVSMGGQRYGALRSAFLYRRSVNPGCGCKIQGQSWEALLRPAERVLASPHPDVILDENEADRLSRAQAWAKLRAEAAQEAAAIPVGPAAPGPMSAGPARAAQRAPEPRPRPDPAETGTLRDPPRR